jgi:hypothetical protein
MQNLQTIKNTSILTKITTITTFFSCVALRHAKMDLKEKNIS